MLAVIVTCFSLGYLAITLEHFIKINKSAIALMMGAVMWTLYAVGGSHGAHAPVEELGHHLGEIAQIAFFLIGALTIVELIDAHKGFTVITRRITTTSSVRLSWIVGGITFFLSAVLDNLTTTIVLYSLAQKLIVERDQRLLFAGMIINLANAGGAWSPVGDVTTTMLWIGGQISATNIIKTLFIPSVVYGLVILTYMSIVLRGRSIHHSKLLDHEQSTPPVRGSKLILVLGLLGLVFVPVFKTLTHLPPYLGMLLSLSVLWIVSELLHFNKEEEERKPYSAVHALQKIDTPSILFFVGILLAVSSLQSMGVLAQAATWMDATFANQDIVIAIIGVLSAVIDNVPLVAGAMGMYSLEQYPMDHKMWEMLAFAAGTGGSILLIGSAAGIAAMGMEKQGLTFGWYLKNITPITLLAYAIGIVSYLVVYPFFAVHPWWVE